MPVLSALLIAFGLVSHMPGTPISNSRSTSALPGSFEKASTSSASAANVEAHGDGGRRLQATPLVGLQSAVSTGNLQPINEVDAIAVNVLVPPANATVNVEELLTITVAHQCGNGRLSSAEACDDGNTDNLDGCDAICRIETGWECESSNPYGSGLGGSSQCTPICGDGRRVGSEGCDDGNQQSGDGCSRMCTEEDGWECVGGSVRSNDACSTRCGDGLRAGDEVCDDGNRVAFDGCSMECNAVEVGFACSGGNATTPDVCVECHASCAACSGPSASECSACAASAPFKSLWVNGSGACVADCVPLGAWGNLSSNTCNACAPNCATCSGPGPEACLGCHAGTRPFLHGTECKSSCPTNGTFALIESGRSECNECDTSCAECDGPSSTSCTVCMGSHPYYMHVPFESGACVATCASDQYVDAQSTCRDCHYTCAACNGPGTTDCTSCPAGSLMQSGTCVSQCEASEYYINPTLSCASCDPSCLSCTGPSAHECTSCAMTEVLHNGTCSATCPQQWFTGGLGACESCDATCGTCTGAGTRDCISCLPIAETSTPYWLGQDGLRRTGGQCLTACPAGFFGNAVAGVCSRCYGSCATCDGPTSSSCTSCSFLTPSYWAGSCYSTCPRGTYNDAGVCRACDSTCKACTGPGMCTACWLHSSLPHLVSGVCLCRAGFRQTANACTEINECTEGTHNCFNDASCVNTAGGFLCTCPGGFSGDGYTCADINECAVVAGGTARCDPRATCNNTYGSFTCECTTEGFTGNGFVCGDADECALGTHMCHQHARCMNREAGYDCACMRGFLTVPDTCETCHGGFRCDDIDECASGLNVCHPTRATCSNSPGSYRCMCLEQYMGDGIVCTDRPPSLPPQPPGYPPSLPPPSAPPPSPSPPGTWTEVAFSSWPADPYSYTDHTHNGVLRRFNGTNGWWGWPNAAQVTTCSGSEEQWLMLGGAGVFSTNAYIVKTFENLPPHTGLRIQADWWKIDRWNSKQLQIFVDGGKAYASNVYSSEGRTHLCGATRWRQGDLKIDLDTTVYHEAANARIYITSSLDGQSTGFWGINNVRVTLQVSLPSPPAPPVTPGTWSAVAQTTWNIGTESEGWSGVPGANMTTTCGAYGTLMGGHGAFGRGAYIEKTYTQLGTHWSIRIRFNFVLIDHWGSENAQLFVDGALVWQSGRYNWNDWTLSDECGRRTWRQEDARHTVDVTAAHYSATATIRITTEASQSYQYWGVQHVSVDAMTPHPSPPAPPFAPGQWSELSRDYWPGRAVGWMSNVQMTATTCGELGTLCASEEPHSLFALSAGVQL